MLSRAAYSVAIPLYSALITEVSPYFSDQTVSFDHCKQTDVVYNEEPENSINYVLMDISSLCFENPDTLGVSVRAYLDALQNELIEQNKEVDAAMLAETTTEGRTALANKAGKAATENTYKKCKALLQEMRAYQKAENFDQPFTPNDLLPAIEIALARYEQIITLEAEVADMVERFETRKLVDRAKGLLNEKMGLSEPEAFRWIQKASMDRRLTMQDVAKAIIEQLSPKKA